MSRRFRCDRSPRVQSFIYAFGRGDQTIPQNRPCAGTQLGLNHTATLIAIRRANGEGVATISGNTPAACGRVFVQAIDYPYVCLPSNVEAL